MSARLRLRDLLRGKGTEEPQPREEGQLRCLVLVGQRIDYWLIRARRRTIGMQIGLDGLTVRAPRWVPIREIEAALVERDEWVVRALSDEHDAPQATFFARLRVVGAPASEQVA